MIYSLFTLLKKKSHFFILELCVKTQNVLPVVFFLLLFGRARFGAAAAAIIDPSINEYIRRSLSRRQAHAAGASLPCDF